MLKNKACWPESIIIPFSWLMRKNWRHQNIHILQPRVTSSFYCPVTVESVIVWNHTLKPKSKLTIPRAANVQRSSRTKWPTLDSWTDFCKEKKKLKCRHKTQSLTEAPSLKFTLRHAPTGTHKTEPLLLLKIVVVVFASFFVFCPHFF